MRLLRKYKDGGLKMNTNYSQRVTTPEQFVSAVDKFISKKDVKKTDVDEFSSIIKNTKTASNTSMDPQSMQKVKDALTKLKSTLPSMKEEVEKAAGAVAYTQIRTDADHLLHLFLEKHKDDAKKVGPKEKGEFRGR